MEEVSTKIDGTVQRGYELFIKEEIKLEPEMELDQPVYVTVKSEASDSYDPETFCGLPYVTRDRKEYDPLADANISIKSETLESSESTYKFYPRSVKREHQERSGLYASGVTGLYLNEVHSPGDVCGQVPVSWVGGNTRRGRRELRDRGSGKCWSGVGTFGGPGVDVRVVEGGPSGRVLLGCRRPLQGLLSVSLAGAVGVAHPIRSPGKGLVGGKRGKVGGRSHGNAKYESTRVTPSLRAHRCRYF
uniref:Uncharacterized protein n=1 Tax=Timema genevievae TaxID=629358 RepID=A0A7R9K2B5_TIMGE|nr:unnamed protein product [Timema genevievae]